VGAVKGAFGQLQKKSHLMEATDWSREMSISGTLKSNWFIQFPKTRDTFRPCDWCGSSNFRDLVPHFLGNLVDILTVVMDRGMGPIGSIPPWNASIPVRQDARQDAVQLGGLVGMLFIPTTLVLWSCDQSSWDEVKVTKAEIDG